MFINSKYYMKKKWKYKKILISFLWDTNASPKAPGICGALLRKKQKKIYDI